MAAQRAGAGIRRVDDGVYLDHRRARGCREQQHQHDHGESQSLLTMPPLLRVVHRAQRPLG
jgi:hypothetical protein